MTVECRVRDDDGLLLADVSGRLGLEDVTGVRLSLFKCLAEQPGALLVDLSELTVADPMALTVFTAVVGQAARWPGTPVLFCAPNPLMSVMLNAATFRRFLRFPSVEEARDHIRLGGHGMPTIAEELLPISGAARHGRDIATDACVRWDLPGLVAAASLVCSELISNVIDHANTMMTLRMSLGDNLLFIAVRDGSPAKPVTTMTGTSAVRGHGLQIVSATAHSWGYLPTHDGKVVWASLLLDA